jgi:phage terminase small subunit
MLEKPGRKSAADLAIVPIESARKPIKPPTDLKPQEAEIFRQVVASCDANHFRKSDIPILTAFATATLSRYYAGVIGEGEGAFKLWEAATRLQISLATKLRITPQSRSDPKTIGRHEPLEGPFPWEIRAHHRAAGEEE